MFDLHTHILPQIDDGAASWAEAYQMLEIAAKDGIKVLAATPHFLEGWFTPTPAEIKAGVERLNQYAQQQGLPIRVIPGMEVALCPDIPRLFQANRLLTLNDEGQYLLVELPANEVPIYTESLLFELQLMGITPVLAHPERNRVIADNPAWLLDQVKRGVLVQLTADSLLGRFGKNTRQISQELLRAGVVHGLGSDAHSSEHRTPTLKAATAKMTELLGREVSHRLAIADIIKSNMVLTGIEGLFNNTCHSQALSDKVLPYSPALCRRLLNAGQKWVKQVIGFK